MLHYNPRHVSSITIPIFRRTNCFITASGIVNLCTAVYREWWYQMLGQYNLSSWRWTC